MCLRCLFFSSLRRAWKVPRWSTISKLQDFETRESPPLSGPLCCSLFASSSPRARNCARFKRTQSYRKFPWYSVTPPALLLQELPCPGFLPPSVRLICTHASAHHRESLLQPLERRAHPDGLMLRFLTRSHGPLIHLPNPTVNADVCESLGTDVSSRVFFDEMCTVDEMPITSYSYSR